jgi:flagellar basal-body rod modification protein FlgD
MVSTTPVSIDTVVKQQSSTSNSSQQLAGDFSQFLTLLTVQLQHQDPLSPMDTTEFTNQLVAFSGVEQQINSNQKLDSLVALQLGNTMGSSLGYVGLNVNYVSSEFNFDGAKPVTMKYALDSQAYTNKISVVDEDGNTIYTKDGSVKVGSNDFTWDGSLTNGGKAKPGTYEIKVNAFDQNGKAIQSTTVVSGTVRGVETQNGIINLLVGDRAVPISNVLNAEKPSTTSTSI